MNITEMRFNDLSFRETKIWNPFRNVKLGFVREKNKYIWDNRFIESNTRCVCSGSGSSRTF